MKRKLPPALRDEWRAPADIPNTVGFRLVVKLNDGREIETAVAKRENGLHHLPEIVRWSDVQGWKPRK